MTHSLACPLVPRVARAVLVIGLLVAGCEHDETASPTGSASTRPVATTPAPALVVTPDASQPAAFRDGTTTLRDGTRVALLAEGIEVRRPAGAAALTLATTRVGRGRSMANARDAAWTEGGDATRMQTERGEVTEVITASAGSVEQSWLIPSEPEGRGDFVIEVAASGLGAARRAEQGVLFGHGDDAIAYSDGVLIGADGERFAVLSMPTERGIELRIDPSVLARVQYPAVLDPTIGPPLRPVVRTPTTISSVYSNVEAVWTGSTYLVLARMASTSLNYRLFTVPGPGLLDTLPVEVTGLASTCAPLDTFWNGTEIVLFCLSGTTVNVHRVGTNGALVSSVALALTAGSDVKVARGASGYLLTWTQGSGTTRNVLGARVATNLTLTDMTPLNIATAVGAQYSPAAVATPSGYLVAYTDDRFIDAPTLDIRTTTIAADGTVGNADGDPLFTVANETESTPLLFASAGRFLMTSRIGASARTQLAEVNAQGALVGTPLTLTSLLPLHSAIFQDGAFQIYVLGTTHSLNVWVPSAPAVSPYPRLTPSFSFGDIAWGDDEAFGVVESTTVSAYFNDLSQPATAPPTATFEYQRPVMTAQGLASDGNAYALLHHESGSLYAEWLALDGTVINGPVVLSATTLADEVRMRGHVEATANGFAIAMPSTRIYLFSPTGTQTANVLTSATSDSPRLSFDGSGLMAFYNGSIARVVSPTGALGASYTVSAAAGTKEDITADAYQGVHLAVWTDGRNSATTGRDIYALRILSNGTRLDQNAITITTAAGDDTIPEVTATDQGWLVSWRTSAGTLGVRSVLEDGTTGAELAFTFGVQPVTQQSLAWGGTQALLVGHSTNGNGLAGYLLNHDGGLVEGPFDLGTVRAATGLGQVASVGNNEFLVAYESFDALSRSDQLFVRRVSPMTPRGEACSTGAQCSSGMCVDGVCCNSACGGGVAGDCAACSIAAGGYVDGSCVFASTATVCRAATGPCDNVEMCLGTSAACPTDTVTSAGVVCRPGTVPCDAAEACDGVQVSCPTDAVATAGTVCRAAVTGGCDVAETCDGSTLTCPMDVVAQAGTVCRSAANLCDVVETCTGMSNACPGNTSLAPGTVCRPATGPCDAQEVCQDQLLVWPVFPTICPSDARRPNGSACPDGIVCNGNETCSSGVCQVAAAPFNCSDANVCTTDTCAEPGMCSNTAIAGCCTAAAQCNDGNACTTDVCTGNACAHNPIPGCCAASADCNDGNPCTADLCSANTCVFTVIGGCCTSAAQCDDSNACTTNVCAGNACSFNAIGGCCTSAAQCDDGNACTTNLCTGNACAFDPIGGCCTSAAQCGDADPCTIDACTGNACSYTTNPACVDGGVVLPDAGTATDAGTNTDAGTSMDAGTTTDAGTATDAGTVTDAGTATDAGTITDVGVPTDADTLPDGGEVSDQGADAEVSDAGDDAAMMDASSGDQGGGVDAGETPPTSAGGCGCRVTTSASQSNALPLMGAMSVLGLMVVRRRRRVAKPNAGA